MHDLRILLRIEFKRAFKSKAFYICLAIGIALAAGSFINKAVPHMDVLKGFTGNAASYPFSVYNSWMGNFVGYEPFATVFICMHALFGIALLWIFCKRQQESVHFTVLQPYV